MRPDGLRLSRRHRAWVYATSAVLFLSGATWWVLHRWFKTAGEIESMPHPWEPGLLKIHGAAAMLMLIVFGTLVPLHMKRGWGARLNRSNGVMLVAVFLLLTASGYALYYAGGEQSRKVASLVHTGLGLASPVALWWHIARGRRARRRQADSPR